MKSWKTTLAGVCAFLLPVLAALKATFDGDVLTVPDYNAILLALPLLGIGVFARDNNVSSEAAGAK